MTHEEPTLDMAEVLREQVRAEKELGRRLGGFVGEWVAVRNHDVVAHAPSPDELMELIRDQEDVEIFQVSADENVVFFL